MGPQANCRFETVKVRLKFGMYRCICLTTPHQNCTPPLVFIPSRLHGRLAKSPYHHRIHRYSYGIFSHRRLYLRSGHNNDSRIFHPFADRVGIIFCLRYFKEYPVSAAMLSMEVFAFQRVLARSRRSCLMVLPGEVPLK